MAARLLLVGHAATAGTRELVFCDQGVVLHPELVEPSSERVLAWVSAPEPACLQTARLLGGEPEVLPGLAGLDAGRWSGRGALEVGGEEPEGLRAWMTDPSAAPHGGESLTDLVARVGACCDGREWPDGRTVAVVTPLVARALAVHALGAPPEVLFQIDVAPLGRVGLSRSGSGWRLQQLG